MKVLIAIVYFVMIGTVSATPIKCIVDGKPIYTDDASTCANGNVSTFPKVTATNKPLIPSPQTLLPNPSVLDSFLEKFGMSKVDVINGWKTIMDAKQRGSWKAPEIPDDDR